ncbi:MAG TPA: tetratricopeptide repeat protein [Pyrinomonadaceae bacterium]|nr:tetratricopeptide repeat protein [Pyrinomonadaceae bacterium]
MELVKHSLRASEDALTDADALARVRLAKRLEEAGDYDAACACLGELWGGVGQRPGQLENLGAAAAAALLLQVGSLTSFVGAEKQIGGSQEAAKNLISEALSIFERLGDVEKVAEAQTDLAYCYWREGALDEARVMLRAALEHFGGRECEAKGVAIIRSAMVELSAGRGEEALRALTAAAPFFERVANHSLKGRFHVALSDIGQSLGVAEPSAGHFERSIEECAAARRHFRLAGNVRYQACVENNLGFLRGAIGQHAEAHEHLDRAASLFEGLGDDFHLAQVRETRARVLVSEGRLEEAEAEAGAAAASLARGDAHALVAEALTTRGKALARLGRGDAALAALARAAEVAERAGDLEGAARATLTVIEELHDLMTPSELCDLFNQADELLRGARDAATRERLLGCARRVMRAATSAPRAAEHEAKAAGGVESWKGFSLKREVLRYEAELIGRALRDADGIVSHAAKLLGFRHHQTFVALLNNRHKELLSARNPIVPRRRKGPRLRAQRGAANRAAS